MHGSIYDADDTAVLVADSFGVCMTVESRRQFVNWAPEGATIFENVRKLVSAARAAGLTVIAGPHLQLVPTERVGPQPNALLTRDLSIMRRARDAKDAANDRPDALSRGCFAGSGLAERLQRRGIKNIVLIGIAANNYVKATAHDGRSFGLHVTFVPDATAEFDSSGKMTSAAGTAPFADAVLATEDLLLRFPRAEARDRAAITSSY